MLISLIVIHKKRALERPSIRGYIEYLISCYKSRYFWWEFWMLFRRKLWHLTRHCSSFWNFSWNFAGTIVVSLYVAFSSAPDLRLLVICYYQLVLLLLHIRCRPFSKCHISIRFVSFVRFISLRFDSLMCLWSHSKYYEQLLWVLFVVGACHDFTAQLFSCRSQQVQWHPLSVFCHYLDMHARARPRKIQIFLFTFFSN